MVDRVLEQDLMRDHLARVAGGDPGHAVLLLGESGVGKSRLSVAAAAVASELGVRVISAQCLGAGAEPLLPVKEALAGHLGRDGESIRRALVGASPRLLDSLPFIGPFLASIGDVLVRGRGERQASLDGVYEELASILIGLADESGLLFVVEDLHQADQDTLYFVNYLLRKIHGRRVLALLTIQEEQLRAVPALADLLTAWIADGYAVLTVVPLERAHIGEYVRQAARMGVNPDDQLVDRLFSLTGGNPFFLKETLALLASPAGPDPAEPEATRIPARLDAVLRARLTRADPQTLQFLQAAAVVAETTQDLEVVAHVMDVDETAAVETLDAAVELRLITEGTQGEIAFVHSLMQRAVYERIGVNRRRMLHRRAAHWCESAGAYASAATHFERAGRTADMVRTALSAADRAEQAGMYHSALVLYQRVRPHMSLEEIGPLLGNAMITLGNWDQAAELVAQLPPDDPRVGLLRSQLEFVRGDFTTARAHARAVLDIPGADRGAALLRLADIELYLGDFRAAGELVEQALAAAEAAGSVMGRARCLGMLGAVAFFGGDVDEGYARYSAALALINGTPEAERDTGIKTVLLGNLGNVAEARGQWAEAERLHSEALRMRRETADARGALHSLHAVGRTKIAQGDRDGGLALFQQAEQVAADLGEPLERAKIAHSRADLALRDGDGENAYRLAASALEAFSESRTGYDIAHAQLTLAAASAATRREREAAEHGAAARASILAHGFGLLRDQYPPVAYRVADRISGALTAYACGDALGLPVENEPGPVPAREEIEALPARRDWPRGATSDDTALTLLVARHLIDTAGGGDAATFLRALAEHPPIQGIGPSTTAAIEHFRATGTVPDSGGTTNGGPMRSLPLGWATAPGDVERLRRRAVDLTRATHPDPDALVASCVMAACAAWSVEDASPDVLLAVAMEEQARAGELIGAGAHRLAAMLQAVRAGNFRPAGEGVSLDPAETVAAALSCVTGATSLRDGLCQAVELGGDTDTVAALAGGLLGAAHTPAEVLQELPWSAAVLLPEPPLLADLGAGLESLRGAPAA
ncbi:ATP-binding protein [Streptomyces antimycoticus]